MNARPNISHRLFAAAITDHPKNQSAMNHYRSSKQVRADDGRENENHGEVRAAGAGSGEPSVVALMG